MPTNLSLAIIESDVHARNDLSGIIGTFGGSVGILAATGDFDEGIRCIRESRPQIVILGVREVEQGAMETAVILSHSPHSSVFVSCAEKNPDWILRLIRAGAGEYLTKPIVAAELRDALKKVSRLHNQRIRQVTARGTAISVYNPTGGMGTTTIAVNLAATLAGRGEKVVLVDLNLFSADVAAFLDLAPRYTLANVIAKSGQIDASFLKSVIVQHPSGVHVLSGPADLGDAENVLPKQIQELIALLQTIFAYTIIDTGGRLFGCNLATFNCSDRILFTTVVDLPSLKNAKRYLATMQKEGFGTDIVKLVVNRHSPRDSIQVSDVEKVLNNKVYSAVPNAYPDVRASIDKGQPLVSCCPRSPVTRAIDELTRKLLSETEVEGKVAFQRGI